MYVSVHVPCLTSGQSALLLSTTRAPPSARTFNACAEVVVASLLHAARGNDTNTAPYAHDTCAAHGSATRVSGVRLLDYASTSRRISPRLQRISDNHRNVDMSIAEECEKTMVKFCHPLQIAFKEHATSRTTKGLFQQLQSLLQHMHRRTRNASVSLPNAHFFSIALEMHCNSQQKRRVAFN